MKLQLSYVLVVASSLALVSAAPSMLVRIEEGRTVAQNQLHELDGDVHATCMGQGAPCRSVGWPTAYCCGELRCSSPFGGLCI